MGYSLDFDEFAVEKRFGLADFDNGYGLVVVVNHAEGFWIQFESRVRLGRALAVDYADGHRQVHRPPVPPHPAATSADDPRR